MCTFLVSTACRHRMAHRKWKETKQQPSMLPGPAVSGCCSIFFHFLWAILCPQAVQYRHLTQPDKPVRSSMTRHLSYHDCIDGGDHGGGTLKSEICEAPTVFLAPMSVSCTMWGSHFFKAMCRFFPFQAQRPQAWLKATRDADSWATSRFERSTLMASKEDKQGPRKDALL